MLYFRSNSGVGQKQRREIPRSKDLTSEVIHRNGGISGHSNPFESEICHLVKTDYGAIVSINRHIAGRASFLIRQ